MTRREETQTIIAQVSGWPMQDKVALAYEILREMRKQTRQPSPRKTLERAVGIARGNSTPPDDGTVRDWVAERRLRKHG